jgi:hypothetical protein
VSQLHVLPGGARLAALHDPLAALRPDAARSALSVVDMATWRQVAPAMCDVLDGFELAAAVPVGGGGGHELIAGSVRLSGEPPACLPACLPGCVPALLRTKRPMRTTQQSRSSCADACPAVA